MFLLLCFQLLFSDNCETLKVKIDSTIKFGFVSIDFNKRNTKIWLPQKLREYGYNYVQMDNYGFPDFEPFAIFIVYFETTGDREKDYRITHFTTKKGYTRHHSLDGKLMLVPYDIHKYVSHQGGIFSWKAKHGML